LRPFKGDRDIGGKGRFSLPFTALDIIMVLYGGLSQYALGWREGGEIGSNKFLPWSWNFR